MMYRTSLDIHFIPPDIHFIPPDIHFIPPDIHFIPPDTFPQFFVLRCAIPRIYLMIDCLMLPCKCPYKEKANPWRPFCSVCTFQLSGNVLIRFI